VLAGTALQDTGWYFGAVIALKIHPSTLDTGFNFITWLPGRRVVPRLGFVSHYITLVIQLDIDVIESIPVVNWSGAVVYPVEDTAFRVLDYN
jgi:hypothetical protein